MSDDSNARPKWECWRNKRHEIEFTYFGWPRCLECGAAPAYHERPSWLDRNTTLLLYVPQNFSPGLPTIAPGSGIVGYTKGGYDVVAYEGWVNGAMQYEGGSPRMLWEAGVFHAAGRLTTGYPSIAGGAFPQGNLLSVGTYNPMTNQFDVIDELHLNEWLEAEREA